MQGFIFEKQSGRILRRVVCPDLAQQLQSEEEDFIETDQKATNLFRVDLVTKTLVAVTPPKTIFDVVQVIQEGRPEQEVDQLIQDMDQTKDASSWKKENYVALRYNSYPNITEFVDAQVKINSGDTALVLKGQQEMAAYVSKCLSVKECFPKPQTEKEK